MEFENFQYESSSSYGALSVVDDTSSVYTANTNEQQQPRARVDVDALSLGGLSLDEDSDARAQDAHVHAHGPARVPPGVAEDIDAVLDDLKDEGHVNLPPHACRSVPARPRPIRRRSHAAATAGSTTRRRS
jgi:regulator of nonsense transcripts 1